MHFNLSLHKLQLNCIVHSYHITSVQTKKKIFSREINYAIICRRHIVEKYTENNNICIHSNRCCLNDKTGPIKYGRVLRNAWLMKTVRKIRWANYMDAGNGILLWFEWIGLRQKGNRSLFLAPILLLHLRQRMLVLEFSS